MSYGDQWALPKIGWDQAYGVVDPAGSAVVAVLDTGVDASHPDLDGNIVAGTSFVAGSSWSSDSNGHGTAMAGIVAAETNNGAGVAGVGYDGVKVMPVTVLGPDGQGRDSDIIEGVVWAADHGADVILMSFSATGYSSALQAAIDYAWSNGVVLVAAAGNDGSSTPAFPAGDRGVIGVSNTDSVRRPGRLVQLRRVRLPRRPRRRHPDHRERRLLDDLRHVGLRGPRRGRGWRCWPRPIRRPRTARSSAGWPATPTRRGPRRRPATAG